MKRHDRPFDEHAAGRTRGGARRSPSNPRTCARAIVDGAASAATTYNASTIRR
jgi:hypothetical protein